MQKHFQFYLWLFTNRDLQTTLIDKSVYKKRAGLVKSKPSAL
ncbi:hypothetical protein HHE02_11090 [Helicobacter heilmannii]|uniref:Uncharacterized protein n=1 Tax=Helicobacter heilmannii TaxID=35817 RepID=A0A0K2XQJ2_HELHE|nr:hypothetical protein HHE02_11090 [Helicobacter heilmannii]CRI33880.1 hypothetical protein HHE01_15660 [Helicobacter heilmannii]